MTARPVTVRSDDLELLLSGELPDAGRVTEAWHRMYAALHEEDSGAAPVSARDALLSLAADLDAAAGRSVPHSPAAGAYRHAAQMARNRASTSEAATGRAGPGKAEARQAGERTGRLGVTESGESNPWYCTCSEAKGPHVHCPWGGSHIHKVDIKTGENLP